MAIWRVVSKPLPNLVTAVTFGGFFAGTAEEVVRWERFKREMGW